MRDKVRISDFYGTNLLFQHYAEAETRMDIDK